MLFRRRQKEEKTRRSGAKIDECLLQKQVSLEEETEEMILMRGQEEDYDETRGA